MFRKGIIDLLLVLGGLQSIGIVISLGTGFIAGGAPDLMELTLGFTVLVLLIALALVMRHNDMKRWEEIEPRDT